MRYLSKRSESWRWQPTGKYTDSRNPLNLTQTICLRNQSWIYKKTVSHQAGSILVHVQLCVKFKILLPELLTYNHTAPQLWVCCVPFQTTELPWAQSSYPLICGNHDLVSRLCSSDYSFLHHQIQIRIGALLSNNVLSWLSYIHQSDRKCSRGWT